MRLLALSVLVFLGGLVAYGQAVMAESTPATGPSAPPAAAPWTRVAKPSGFVMMILGAAGVTYSFRKTKK